MKTWDDLLVKLNELEIEYKDYLDEYDDGKWAEHVLNSFRNNIGGMFDERVANKKYQATKRILEKRKRSSSL